jgi:hypothetical protein
MAYKTCSSLQLKQAQAMHWLNHLAQICGVRFILILIKRHIQDMWLSAEGSLQNHTKLS